MTYLLVDPHLVALPDADTCTKEQANAFFEGFDFLQKIRKKCSKTAKIWLPKNCKESIEQSSTYPLGPDDIAKLSESHGLQINSNFFFSAYGELYKWLITYSPPEITKYVVGEPDEAQTSSISPTEFIDRISVDELKQAYINDLFNLSFRAHNDIHPVVELQNMQILSQPPNFLDDTEDTTMSITVTFERLYQRSGKDVLDSQFLSCVYTVRTSADGCTDVIEGKDDRDIKEKFPNIDFLRKSIKFMESRPQADQDKIVEYLEIILEGEDRLRDEKKIIQKNRDWNELKPTRSLRMYYLKCDDARVLVLISNKPRQDRDLRIIEKITKKDFC